MSGLEEFQTCEAWKKNIKKFLFMERKPEAFKKTVTESQRYSLDIDEDLKNIIEEKKKRKRAPENNLDIVTENTKSTMESDLEKKEKNIRVTFKEDKIINEQNDTHRKRPDDSFEALEKLCEKTVSDPNSTLYKYLNIEEEHKTNNFLVWEKTSDESFEALERMCDKTASDPNNTLFQYLHGTRKDKVLAKAKKCADDNFDNIREKQDNLFVKLNNCTLLDDVEAPSRMWENTICDDTAPQTSPIKMVGLLRPSTIIEEAADDIYNSDISSQLSFKTATKAVQSDVSSSTYDTAHDSTATSNQTDNSIPDRKQELEIIDVDHILLPVLEKIHKQKDMEDLIIPTINIIDDATLVETSSLSNEHNSPHTWSVESDLHNNEATLQNAQKQNENENLILPTLDIIDATIVETPSLTTNNDNEDINNPTNDSTSLINLEQIFGSLCNSSSSSLVRDDSCSSGEAVEQDFHALNKSKITGDDLLNDSVIELSDDDEEEEENKDINISPRKEELCVSIKLELTSKNSFSLDQDTYSFTLDDNKENEIDMGAPADKSMQFNNTMEEVEYMLKKGMEYMAAEAASKQEPKTIEVLDHLPRQHSTKMQSSSPMTSIQQPKNVSTSGSKVKSSTYCTPAKKTTPAKCQNFPRKQFDIDIRPFPKLDIFSKVPVHARHKELASKQEKFSHIVSPIGTYMKKTARTPLMSSINSKTVDYFNSTAIQELENESRLYQRQFAISSGEAAGLPPKLPGLINSKKTPLPKKAYISSDLKHIVDERTPVTIPGGKKIQKYLENAIMPAVLRHDGKFKIPGTGNKLNTATSTAPAFSLKQSLKASNTNTTGATKISHIPRRNNASLADLSLMSGDVSMYTIMDAQKF